MIKSLPFWKKVYSLTYQILYTHHSGVTRLFKPISSMSWVQLPLNLTMTWWYILHYIYFFQKSKLLYFKKLLTTDSREYWEQGWYRLAMKMLSSLTFEICFIVFIIFSSNFFSAAPKTKTTKTMQKKKGTKGTKTYESSPRWKNINIEFGADLVGDQE